MAENDIYEHGFITPTPSPTPDILMDPYLRDVRETSECYSPYEQHVFNLNRQPTDFDRISYVQKTISELRGYFGVDEKVIIYALYACSGDVEMTKKFFTEGKVMLWTPEEDNILTSNDSDKIFHIIMTRGKTETEKRCHFLSCNGNFNDLMKMKY